MKRARRPAVHRRRAPAGAARSTCSASRSPPSSATPTCSRALDLAGIPLDAQGPRRSTTRSCWPAGTPAFNPEPIADFIDAAVLGDGEEAVLEITGIIREWKAEGCPGGRDELLLRLARTESIYVPALLRRRLPARRPDPAGRAEPAGRAVPGRQAHDDGPRRLAVPEEAAGPAGRDGARAVRGGDLPGLHPGLPVLPGRHDHPAGPGAVDHHGRARWSRRGWSSPASPRWACSRCPAPTTPRSATCAPAWPSSTRTPTSRCRCRRPGWTPSTSTWPRSCPATGGAPA